MGILDFQRPWLLALIPVIWLILFFLFRRDKLGFKWWVSFALRSLAIIVFITILAGIRFLGKSPDKCRLYLIDNSGSVYLNRMELLDAIQKDIKSLKPSDKFGIIVFGADASVEVLPASPADFKPIQEFSSSINKNNTDISKAIKTAMEIFPLGYQKEITLVSDGLETTGRTFDMIPLLRNEGITINTFPVGANNLADIAIKYFSLPKFIEAGKPLSGYVILESLSHADVDLYLYESGKLINQWKKISLNAGEQFKIGFEVAPSENPVNEYEITAVTNSFKELCTVNNTSRAISIRTAKPAILYSAGQNSLGGVERIIRANQTFRIDSKKSLDNLQLYDALILDNISKNELPDKALDDIKSFVENGGGLLILGGKQSYALGGYINTVLEEISPVWVSPPDNIGLVVILDRSGSMAETVNRDTSKWQIARKALSETMNLLSTKDEYEVIAFNDKYNVIQPMQLFNKASLSEGDSKLGKIGPDGSTVILSPIKLQAIQSLAKTKSGRKHIILISDGTSTTGETAEEAAKLGEELAKQGITISVLATGDQVDEKFLKSLCRDEKNGKFYRITDFMKLTDFLKEDLVYHKELYSEGKFKSESKDNSFSSALPDIAGYNRVSAKKRAKVIVAISNNMPLLTEWYFGKGKVIAFASELGKSWMNDWLTWLKLGEFWQFVLEKVIPQREKEGDFTANAYFNDNQNVRVQIKSLKRDYNLKLSAEVIKENKVILTQALSQFYPAVYETDIPGLSEGTYLISIYNMAEGKAFIKTIPFVIPYSAEWNRFGVNIPLLSVLAGKTGGEMLKTLPEVELDTKTSSEARSFRDKDALLVLIALGLLLLDLILGFIVPNI
jgi:uncharacterized membrane protein